MDIIYNDKSTLSGDKKFLVPNMGKRLWITEKPSVAKTLSNFLNIRGGNNDGYFEGEQDVVTFAFGHLLELYDMKDYNESMAKWQLINFPFIPEEFKYKIKTNKKDKKIDTGSKKQATIIKRLINRKDIAEVLMATDSDREGTVIGMTLINYAETNKPVKRIFVNEWTSYDIKRGLNNLKTLEEIQPQIDSGFSRQYCDYLIGINFTTVLTLVAQSSSNANVGVLNVGRVILPTLKLIYDRDMEIKNFIPKKYFELKACFQVSNGRYEGLLFANNKDTCFNSKSEIKCICKGILNKKGSITDKKVEKKNQYAPRLFNMSDLQGYMSSKYKGWTANKVKKVAQSLYEGKGKGGFISYPRTNSRVLEESLIKKIQKVLTILAEDLSYKDHIKFHTSKRVFDSSKVDSHSAITPTHIKPTVLSKDEQLLYSEILKRFVSQFMPPANFEYTQIITSVENFQFITKGKILLKEGWLKVYNKKEENKDLLPNVNIGEIAEVVKNNILSKETQPSTHHTEKTLLKAMETCGRNLKGKDQDEDDVLTGYEIGTAATRDETIVKLLNVNYIERKGKSLVVTSKGIQVIDSFPVKTLLDVTYTGRMEKALSEIEKGNYTKEQFMRYIIKFVREGVREIKKSSVLIDTPSNSTNHSNFNNEVLGKCPSCGSDIIENSKAYGCTGYRSGCKFVIWKNDKFLEKFKKKTTKTMAKNLLKNNKTFIKGLTSKNGEKFDCYAELIQNDKGYWNFNFIFDDNSSDDSKSLIRGIFK